MYSSDSIKCPLKRPTPIKRMPRVSVPPTKRITRRRSPRTDAPRLGRVNNGRQSNAWRPIRTMKRAWFFQHLARPGFVIRHGPSPDISQLVYLVFFPPLYGNVRNLVCFFGPLLLPVSRPPKRKKYANTLRRGEGALFHPSLLPPFWLNGGASSMFPAFSTFSSRDQLFADV